MNNSISFQKNTNELDELLLKYGAVRDKQAIDGLRNETITSLDLTNLPIEVAVADINLKTNDEYVLLRRQGFGASDSGILLGVNPYTTLDELIKQKATTTISEEERAVGELVAVKKGRDLEPLILHKFEKAFKQETLKPKDMYKFKEYPYLAVNFDGVTGIPGQYIPAEIKVVTTRGERHYNPSKAMYNEIQGFLPLPQNPEGHNWSIETKSAYYGIPPYYYTQLQQQIFALNAPFGYLSVLFEKTWQFYSFFIYRDEAVIKDLIINGYKAWEKVEAIRGGVI